MRHAKYRQWLSLSLFGELSMKEQEILEAHLAECDSCRAEELELKEMLRAVKSQLPEPPLQLVREARAQLRGALRAEPMRSGAAQTSWRSRVGIPLALAASLAAGLFLGRVLLPADPNVITADYFGGDTGLANIQFLDSDEADGQLEVSFDAVRRVRLKAPPSDPRVQAVLLEAIRRGDNPGTRIRAVAAVEEDIRPRHNQAVKQALMEALADENVGVRRRALAVLQSMPRDQEIRQALIEVLIHDQNAGLRIAAINALESDALAQGPLDQETLRQLEQRLNTENNDFIRLRSEAWLEEVRFQ